MPPAKPRSRRNPASKHPTPVTEIIARLDEAYGIPDWRPHHDPASELVLTILSQNTSDANSGRAFARLLQRFPTWDDVIAAPLPELIAAIQPGGLAPTKAPRIQAALLDIKERTGGYDLGFLADLPLEEAREWLRSIHGVGPKTVACVLLFALGMPAMPVDTHVFRVATRLALIPERVPTTSRRSSVDHRRASAARSTAPNDQRPTTTTPSTALTPEKAHTLLEAMVQPGDYYAFHIGLIKHGRRTCTAQRPKCGECVLRDLCPSASRYISGPVRRPAKSAAVRSRARKLPRP